MKKTKKPIQRKSLDNYTTTMRKQISEILVKWGMPTRQAAISEIIEVVRGQIIVSGKVIVFDTEDYNKLIKYTWNLDVHGYPVTRINNKVTFLHNLIIKSPNGLLVDHIDRNKLNNHKDNLRVVTSSQSNMNKGKQKNNKSGYRGVYWDNNTKRWQAKINLNKKSIFLGTFRTAIDAAKKYNEASRIYHGKYGYINEI
jgi:hypothetical protein